MTLWKKNVSVVQRAVIKVKKESLNVYHVQMERGPSATILGTLLLVKVEIPSLLMPTVTFYGKFCLSHQFSMNTDYDSVSKKGPPVFLLYP